MYRCKLNQILPLIVPLFFALNCHANNVSVFEVKNAACKVYLQVDGKVSSVTSELFPVGSKVSVAVHSKSPRFFVTRHQGKTYLLQQGCFEAPVQVKKAPQWQARIIWLSYQVPITIRDPLQGDFAVTTHTNALCMGAGYSRAVSESWRVNGTACALIGKADARGAGSNASNTQTYQSEGVGVFGFRTTFGVQYLPKSEGVRVGFSIPILYDAVSFDNAGGLVTVSRSPVHLLGLLLNLELSRGKYTVLSEFGFLQKFTQSTWSLGLAYPI